MTCFAPLDERASRDITVRRVLLGGADLAQLLADLVIQDIQDIFRRLRPTGGSTEFPGRNPGQSNLPSKDMLARDKDAYSTKPQ